MKLTGKLKDKVESAETMEAKKGIIADAGMELTDEELDGVVGGSHPRNDEKPVGEKRCPMCGNTLYHNTDTKTFLPYVMCKMCDYRE